MHSEKLDRYYITTPIYYPNGEPHIGHCYTTIAADTMARYYRLMKVETFFLTGTDEHGIKMVKTATEQKTEPAVLADHNANIFRKVWDELDITHDDFIRTTEPRHKVAVQEIVRRLQANGDIYLGGYEGWYDEGQEEFVTETEAKDNQFNSKINGKPLVRFSEPTYYFRLSKYADRILEYIAANPQFIQPDSKRNEVVSKLKAGLNDLSISRATLRWGIEMPGDPGHVLYVWIDALSNYITALGYGTEDESRFRKMWPVDLHLIGKEILWFHAVYWPAMLMSLNLPLPKKLFAHGWWTSNGMKMGKSTGNFIGMERIRTIGGKEGYDALRFYLFRAAPFGSDLDWTDADFKKSYNELADVLGNLLNRVLNMVGKYCAGILPARGQNLEQIDSDFEKVIAEWPAKLHAAYEAVELQQAAMLPIELARYANGYVEAAKPWSLAKDSTQIDRLNTVLYLATKATYLACVGLLPLIPGKSRAALEQLGVILDSRSIPDLFANPIAVGTKIGKAEVLFPKFDEKKV